jgi:hypothetical protein
MPDQPPRPHACAPATAEIALFAARSRPQRRSEVFMANLAGDLRRVSLRRPAGVTLMRHLFIPSGTVLLLAHLVVPPPGIGLLIAAACRPLPVLSRPRRTHPAIAVAPVTPPADHHLSIATLASEDPAVSGHRAQARMKGALQGRAEG